jgi:hypothetical protein
VKLQLGGWGFHRGEGNWGGAWRQTGDEVMREVFNDRSSDHARRTAVEFNRRVRKALRLVVGER